MATNPKSVLLLPPLQVGKYLAAEFERFEYSSGDLGESRAILRLILKNGTKVDLPATHDDMHHLLTILCQAYPGIAIRRLKATGRI